MESVFRAQTHTGVVIWKQDSHSQPGTFGLNDTPKHSDRTECRAVLRSYAKHVSLVEVVIYSWGWDGWCMTTVRDILQEMTEPLIKNNRFIVNPATEFY